MCTCTRRYRSTRIHYLRVSTSIVRIPSRAPRDPNKAHSHAQHILPVIRTMGCDNSKPEDNKPSSIATGREIAAVREMNRNKTKLNTYKSILQYRIVLHGSLLRCLRRTCRWIFIDRFGWCFFFACIALYARTGLYYILWISRLQHGCLTWLRIGNSILCQVLRYHPMPRYNIMWYQ